MAETDSMNPYYDAYDIFNQFDRILFIPGRPLLQSELNEMQSSQQDQQRLLTNWSMNDGTILSGMGYRDEGYTDTNDVPDDTNDNLFVYGNNNPSFNNLIASTGDTYTDHGEIDLTSDASNDHDPLTMDVQYQFPSDSQYITLSFDIIETGGDDGGRLENLAMTLANGTSIAEATIDGRVLKSGELTDDASYNLTDTRNDLIDLSDGNWHQVIVTMDVSKDGATDQKNNKNKDNSFSLGFNNGFGAVTEGCNLKLNHFKIEEGTEPTAWELNQESLPAGSPDTRSDTANISSGFLYLDGYARHFNNQTVRIKGEGFEKIGVKLSRETISSAQDKELNDRTQGAETYGSPAADREKYNVSLTYGDEPHDAIIYYLHNGQVVADANTNRKARLENELAQRTYETNGSFLAGGLKMFAHPNRYDPSLINLQFAPGTAYVLGHRIHKDGSDILPIPTETDTTPQLEEPHRFVADPNDPSQYEGIAVNNQPFQLEFNDDDHTGGIYVHGRFNGTQIFSFTPESGVPSTINQVDYTMNSDGTLNITAAHEMAPNTYISFDDSSTDNYVFAGTDPNHNRIYSDNGNNYSVDEGNNTVTWNNDNVAYADGQSLFGETIYIVAHEQGSFRGPSIEYQAFDPELQEQSAAQPELPDYCLIKVNGKVYISFNQSDVSKDITGTKISRLSGNKPIVGSADAVYVDYYPYDTRDDLITLNSNGKFTDIQGLPALGSDAMPPANVTHGKDLTLNIGVVKVLPDQQVAYTQMSTVPKIPFTGLNNMNLAINNLEYNFSILAAHEAAVSGVDPTTLVDTFTDYFINHDKAGVNDALFDILYNPAPYIAPSYDAEGYIPLCTNQDLNTSAVGNNSIQAHRDPNNPENDNYLSQDVSTDSLQLNNYGYSTHIGVIECDPNSFHDTTSTEQFTEPTVVREMNDANAQQKITKNYVPLYTQGGNAAVKDMELSPQKLNEFQEDNHLNLDGDQFESRTSTLTYHNRRYMASHYVHIQGSGFVPFSKDYKVYFPNENDLELPVSAYSPAETDQQNDHDPIYGQDNPNGYKDGVHFQTDLGGTVDADGNGNISCWFLIPSRRIKAGHQMVELANGHGERAITYIDGSLTKPISYNHVNDIIVNNDDIINFNSEVNSATEQSIVSSMNYATSSLSSATVSLSTSASASLSNVTSIMDSDDSSLNASLQAQSGLDQARYVSTLSVEARDESTVASLASLQALIDSETQAEISGAISAQDVVNESVADHLDDLDSSCTSLYIDHLTAESQIGNLRTGLDNAIDQEQATENELQGDEATYNADFNNMSTDISNNAAAIDNNAQDISNTNAQVSTDVNEQNAMNANLGDFSAKTGRALTYNEFHPDEYSIGGHKENYFKHKFHGKTVNSTLYSIGRDKLMGFFPSVNRWDANQVMHDAQTKGGGFIKLHNGKTYQWLKPGWTPENGGIQKMMNVFNRAQRQNPGVHLVDHKQMRRYVNDFSRSYNYARRHGGNLPGASTDGMNFGSHTMRMSGSHGRRRRRHRR